MRDYLKAIKRRYNFAKNLVNAELFRRMESGSVEYGDFQVCPCCDTPVKIYAQLDPTSDSQAVMFGISEWDKNQY